MPDSQEPESESPGGNPPIAPLDYHNPAQDVFAIRSERNAGAVATVMGVLGLVFAFFMPLLGIPIALIAGCILASITIHRTTRWAILQGVLIGLGIAVLIEGLCFAAIAGWLR